MMDLGEIILKNDVLEISMYDFVDRNGPFDDNFNEPMYESWLHLQDANKTKAFSCELTVKWTIFACRNSKYNGTFAMFYKQDTLTLAITNITDRLSWASALSDPYIIFLSSGLSVLSNL